MFGCGVSAHPKLVMVPDTVCPWPGVSIVPNGVVALALLATMVFVPRDTVAPSSVRMKADSVKVPLPWFGNIFVRSM